MSDKIYKLIDENGEVIDNFTVRKGETIGVLQKKKNLTPKQNLHLTEIREMKEISELLGGYIHMAFIKNDLLFNNLNLSPGTITRLIYLATYLEYDNKEKGVLMYKGVRGKHIPMTRKTMRKVLRLGERSFYEFLYESKDNNMIFETKEKLYLNPEYFSKGKCDFKKGEYTRIYIDSIRNLFDNTKVSQHKQLSYILRLIPFTHYQYNVICFNPNETNFKLIKDMTLEDICNLFNVGDTNKSRFKKNLLKFWINLDGEKFYLFKYVKVEGLTKDHDYFVVNPYVIFKGNDSEVMKSIAKLFYFDE